MTASTPNPPDSGAAASRDAARTARRLTDGTLPRTTPPPPPPPGDPSGADAAPASGPGPLAPADTDEAVAPGTGGGASPAPGHTAAPPAGASPVSGTAAAPGTGRPVAREDAAPGAEGGASSAPGVPSASGAAESPATGGAPPAAPGTARPVGGAASSVAGPSGTVRPVGGERAAAAGPGGSPSPAGHTAAASAPRATPADTVRAVGREAVASTVTDPSGGAGAAGLGAAPVAGAAAPRVAGGAVPPLAGAAASRATEGSPASGRAVPSAGAAGASPGSGAAASQAPATPAAPAAASDTVRPVGREAVASPVTDPSGGAGAAAPRVAGGSVTPLAGAASAPLAGTANAAPVNGAAAPHAAGASASAAPTLSPASAPDAPGTVRPATAGGAAGGGFRVAFGEKPDFRVITTARIGALAEPVAGVVRVVRRKNVIGTETTGSIPVHLLFRDEPHTAPKGDADDGGPDTVAMDAPGAKPRRTVIPSPGAVQAQGRKTARHAAAVSRPAPTADPDLVERPGRALPGWVGVVGGALAVAGSAAVVWWAGAVPAELARMLRLPVRPYHGIHLGQWALLALGVVATLFALGGLGRGRVGYAWVLTLFGDYRGTVRRTGLVWISPLLLRRRVDVRLRHWRSEPLPAVDAKGTALDVVVLVVWRVRDTVRAALGVDGHEDYLREQVEAAMARVLSQLPADAFHEDAPTLRDAEAVGEALTRMLSAECAPVGVDVFSAQPTRIEYAPAVAAAMQRRRIAAIDAKHRDSVLTSVVDAVDDVVHRLTSRGLVELDDYERKALVKDLTVAFYTGRTAPAEGA